MTNHIHLLLTPSSDNSIQRVFQHLGRQYAQYINKTYNRSGSLWEGRHKGSLIFEDRYLFSCYGYIELNPVTANMVNKPEDYPWSSFQLNAFGTLDSLITPHDSYLSITKSPANRLIAYRKLFDTPLHKEARPPSTF